jgi:hypothetical protein
MGNGLKAIGIIAAILVSSASSHSQTPSASSARSLSTDASFARIRSKIDVERVGQLTTKAIAGKYSSSPDELVKRVIPFSGDDLYLFPDGSYIDLFWSDVPPPTIQDKGHWVVSEGEVRLTSDPVVTWIPGTERRYLLIRRGSHPEEILAVGLESDIPDFEKNANRDPEFQLLIHSKMQISRISAKASVQIQKKLMRDAWRPHFYTSEQLCHRKK